STGVDRRLESEAHMRALARCLLAIALAAQFALAGLCLVHDAPDDSAHVIHFPCAHQYQTHAATLRLRRLHTADRIVKRPSLTMASPVAISVALLLWRHARDLVGLQSRPDQAERATLSARGPP